MNIEITKNHIKNGTADVNTGYGCPIALALKKQFKTENVFVDWSGHAQIDAAYYRINDMPKYCGGPALLEWLKSHKHITVTKVY